MKKWLCLASIVLILASCSSPEKEIIGQWKINYIALGDVGITGGSIYFDDDSTIVLSMKDGSSAVGKWYLIGNDSLHWDIATMKNTFRYELGEDKLSLEGVNKKMKAYSIKLIK